MGPRLTAAAFGMTEGGAVHYVTGAVDSEEHTFGGPVSVRHRSAYVRPNLCAFAGCRFHESATERFS